MDCFGMESKVEIVSIWEDDDLFEVKVFASNGLFAGTADCYTHRSEMERLGNIFQGFPKSVDQVVDFTTYYSDALSYFSINLKCMDRAGHVNARIKVAHIVTYSDRSQQKYISEFDLGIEPAAIDQFADEIRMLSRSGIGKVKAVLKGKI